MTNNQTLPFHVEQSKSGKWNVWVFQQQSEKVWSYIAKQTFKTYDDAYSWGLNYTHWTHLHSQQSCVTFQCLSIVLMRLLSNVEMLSIVPSVILRTAQIFIPRSESFITMMMLTLSALWKIMGRWLRYNKRGMRCASIKTLNFHTVSNTFLLHYVQASSHLSSGTR